MKNTNTGTSRSRRNFVAASAAGLLAATAEAVAAPFTSHVPLLGPTTSGVLDTRLPPSGISALSWLVADATSGDVLASYQPHRRLAPASTLKALFAITVLPQLDSSSLYRVSASDLREVPAGSSVVGLQAGRQYSVEDLWRGVFLRSGNDAVHVLARMNGGWSKTAGEMESRARSLGARDTTVVSPDGFDAPGQVSSAHDLAVFGLVGLSVPEFSAHCSTARCVFPDGGGIGKQVSLINTNRLLSGANGVVPYPGIIGVKNGYTSRAGNTLIAAARRSGRTIVVTVMNPQSGKANAVYEEARTLLDWGFATTGKSAIGRLPVTSGALVGAAA
ncbi:D-alanyl-D-alanine carboxypeptidase family protein [Streptomyces sp. NPDC006879]|uniref:D-alanyl-D-alanine carboxypeptidase family protein n=1 Tax=Streptomyces sp. NPDC006879 TaxID=3364767 RepID=UPI0036BCC638